MKNLTNEKNEEEEDVYSINDEIMKNHGKTHLYKAHESMLSNTASIQNIVNNNREDNAFNKLKNKADHCIEQGKIVDGLNYYESGNFYPCNVVKYR